MTQEEKELLVSLLKEANENNILDIYDDDEENLYEVDWVFIDNKVCIKIKPF